MHSSDRSITMNYVYLPNHNALCPICPNIDANFVGPGAGRPWIRSPQERAQAQAQPMPHTHKRPHTHTHALSHTSGHMHTTTTGTAVAARFL